MLQTVYSWAQQQLTSVSQGEVWVPLAVIAGAIVTLKAYKTITRAPDTYDSHIFPHGPLQRVTEDVYIVEGTLALPVGGTIPRTMVIYMLSPSKKGSKPSLLIHSCIAVDSETSKKIEELGEPEWLIVPSVSHKADTAVFVSRFPSLKVICPKGAKKAVETVARVHGVCEDILPPLGITLHFPPGLRLFELVYLLQSKQLGGSRTQQVWLVCDVIQNLSGPLTWIHGFFERFTGSPQYPCANGFYKTMFVKDKKALAKWLSAEMVPEVKEDDLLIPGHGKIVQDKLREKMLRAAEQL